MDEDSDRVEGSAPGGPPARSPVPGAVAVVGDAVAVLQAFTVSDIHLTPGDIAGRTGLLLDRVSTLIEALVAAGLLVQDRQGYGLTTLLFELGTRSAQHQHLIEVCTPVLQNVYETTRETVHLGVREGADVLYISKFGGHTLADVPSRVGQRLPLHCSAIGKVLLASGDLSSVDALPDPVLVRMGPATITDRSALLTELRSIRVNGVGFEVEESAAGLACVAAPIRGAHGRVVAAVSIASPRHRFAAHHGFPQVVKDAADLISTVLGFADDPVPSGAEPAIDG